MNFLKRDINLGKREKLLLGFVVLAFIEVIYFYFRGKPYNGINSLGDMPNYVMIGLVAFFIAYYALIEKQNIRKKHWLIGIAYAALVAAPFVFERDIPKVNVEDAQDLIARTEGGKIVKDREYSNKIDTYEGQEVYLIALEKKDNVYRYAFDPYLEQYYPFSN
ncbi:MAG TPA: hypothetical protein H9983_04915 [Candidatus Kurthia intestinigallinarum]|nr:hypothetical protein [Candidatus Kurthia intestinigallinarum]